MSYKISIIIPCFNAQTNIKRAIKSIKNQTFGFDNIEIIIVDDCSTDNTVSIIKELIIKHDNIKLFFTKENTGSPSTPRNIGINNATSNYIMFLDQDDIYHTKFVEKSYNEIIKNNAEIVGCRYLMKINNNYYHFKNPLIKKQIFNPKIDHDIFDRTMIWDKIFDKNFLNTFNIRFPDGCVFEDVYFMTNCYLHAKKIVMLNDFFGYCWFIENNAKNLSLSHNITYSHMQKLLKCFKKEFKLFKNVNQNLTTKILSNHLCILLALFIKMDKNNNFIDIFSQIREIESQCDYNFELEKKWGKLINQTIVNNNIKTCLLYCKLINFILNSRLYNLYLQKTYVKTNMNFCI